MATLGRLLGDSVHGLCQIANILGGDASHGDPAILGEVDAEVLGDGRHLVLGHPGKAEHTNLVSNVLPVAGGS